MHTKNRSESPKLIKDMKPVVSVLSPTLNSPFNTCSMIIDTFSSISSSKWAQCYTFSVEDIGGTLKEEVSPLWFLVLKSVDMEIPALLQAWAKNKCLHEMCNANVAWWSAFWAFFIGISCDPNHWPTDSLCFLSPAQPPHPQQLPFSSSHSDASLPTSRPFWSYMQGIFSSRPPILPAPLFLQHLHTGCQLWLVHIDVLHWVASCLPCNGIPALVL